MTNREMTQKNGFYYRNLVFMLNLTVNNSYIIQKCPSPFPKHWVLDNNNNNNN